MGKILTFKNKKPPENKGEVNFARFAKHYLPDDFILITNPDIHNVEIDFILLSSEKFLIVEIKYWLGVVVENPFGKWKIIYREKVKEEYDPFSQAQRERRAVNKFIYDKFGIKHKSKCLIINMAPEAELHVAKRMKNFILFQYKNEESLKKLIVEGNFGKLPRDMAIKLKKNFLSYWSGQLEESDPDVWAWDCFSNNKTFICLHPRENKEVSEQNNDAILNFIQGYPFDAITKWEDLLYSFTVSPIEKSFIVVNLAYAYYRVEDYKELVNLLYTQNFIEEAQEFRDYLEYLLAIAYFKLGGRENLEAALRIARPLLSSTQLVEKKEVKKLLFNIYSALHDWKRARKILQELIEKEGENGNLQQRLELIERKLKKEK